MGLAVRYGLRFQYLPGDLPSDKQAPFSAWVGIAGATVLYSELAQPGGLIHEAGHVLFGFKREEYEFFVWEWHIAKWLGLEKAWRENNVDYMVGSVGDADVGDAEFGELSEAEQTYLLLELHRHTPSYVRRMFPV